MSRTILLVEDNEHIMKINRDTLHNAGYRVLEAETAAQAREIFMEESPALIVLDIMLPDGDGLALCRRIRGDSNIPIIFLSAKKAKAEIIEGLKSGGDDYLPKPYDVDVLLARIEALLRRAGSVPETLTLGPLTLDIVSGIAYLNRENLLLTQKEFAVLFLLVKNAERIVDKDDIFKAVWGQTTNDDRTALWTVISRLKKKLQPAQTGITISMRRPKGYILELL